MRFAAVVVACMLTACANRVDRIFVRDAQLAGLSVAVEEARGDREEETFFALEPHRVGEGQGVVFTRRAFDPGWRLVIDDESFELISWAVPRIDVAASFDVQRDRLAIRYSRGSSAFPDQACLGVESRGRIDIEPRTKDTIYVGLALRITTKDAPGALRGGCSDVEILDRGIYEAKGVSQLTPWLGAPFEHPYDASYAR